MQPFSNTRRATCCGIYQCSVIRRSDRCIPTSGISITESAMLWKSLALKILSSRHGTSTESIPTMQPSETSCVSSHVPGRDNKIAITTKSVRLRLGLCELLEGLAIFKHVCPTCRTDRPQATMRIHQTGRRNLWQKYNLWHTQDPQRELVADTERTDNHQSCV